MYTKKSMFNIISFNFYINFKVYLGCIRVTKAESLLGLIDKTNLTEWSAEQLRCTCARNDSKTLNGSEKYREAECNVSELNECKLTQRRFLCSVKTNSPTRRRRMAISEERKRKRRSAYYKEKVLS